MNFFETVKQGSFIDELQKIAFKESFGPNGELITDYIKGDYAVSRARQKEPIPFNAARVVGTVGGGLGGAVIGGLANLPMLAIGRKKKWSDKQVWAAMKSAQRIGSIAGGALGLATALEFVESPLLKSRGIKRKGLIHPTYKISREAQQKYRIHPD